MNSMPSGFKQLLLLWILAIACVTPTAAIAQTTLKVSLDEAIEIAIKNNLEIKQKELDVQKAQYQVTEILAAGLPQVSGSVNYQRFLKLPAQLVPGIAFGQPDQEFVKLTFGTNNNLTAGLEANQLIFSGAYLLGIDASKKYVDLARKQIETGRIGVKDGVTQAYLANLIMEETIITLNKNKQIIEKILYETTELNKNGFAEALDVDRLQLSKQNLITQLETAERQKEFAKTALKYQMTIDPLQEIELTATLADFVKEAEAITIQNLQPKERIELQLLSMQNALNDLDQKRLEAEYLPTVAAFGSVQTSFQANDFKLFDSDKWIPTAVVGLQVSVPIFDGRRKEAQIQQRHVLRRQLKETKKGLQHVINLQITQAKVEYENALDNVESNKKSLALANKIYQTVLLKYKEGLGASFEVTDAERSLFETQALYTNALYQLVLAKTALDKALGFYQD